MQIFGGWAALAETVIRCRRDARCLRLFPIDSYWIGALPKEQGEPKAYPKASLTYFSTKG